MLNRILRPRGVLVRSFTTSTQNLVKVAIAGASGGIGQPLAMLFKLSPLVTELSLYDVKYAPGVAKDLSHIDTPTKVTGFGPENIKCAFHNAEIIVLPAGLPRKPGMTRDDLFTKNATIVADITKVVAETAPNAIYAIITNPINSTVPIAAEILKKAGKFDPKRLFGVTTLDVVRANTFLAELEGVKPETFNVPVIGGHSPETMIPVISQAKPGACIKEDKLGPLIKRIQNAGTEVVEAKEGSGSATLSMAYAAAKLVFSLIKAINGERNISECAYVCSDVVKDVAFFATPLLLGCQGIERNLGLGKLSKFEEDLLQKAIPVLKKNIEKGTQFGCEAANAPPAPPPPLTPAAPPAPNPPPAPPKEPPKVPPCNTPPQAPPGQKK